MVKKASLGKLRKTWFSIITPRLFGNQVLGEVPCFSGDKLMGRTLTINLMNLTRDMRSQNINLSFVIGKIAGDKAYTQLIGYKIMPSVIKRLVRRAGNKADYVINADTADNKTLILKLLFVTRTLAKNSTLTSLRKKSEEFLKEHIKKMKYDDFLPELVNHRLQNNLKKHLHKITPLKTCEIRDMRLIIKKTEDFKVDRPKKPEAAKKSKKTEEDENN